MHLENNSFAQAVSETSRLPECLMNRREGNDRRSYHFVVHMVCF
jgi:hypothetical protein